MRRIGGWTIGVVALLVAARSGTTAGKAAPVAVQAEAQKFAAGEPLSFMALVAQPGAIDAVKSWTLETQRHRGPMAAMALSPDGRLLATGGFDGMIRLWDVETGKFQRVLVGHHSHVFGLAYSPDGNTLASTGSWDRNVRLWDVKSGRTLRTLSDFKQFAHLVVWSPDGTELIACGDSSGRVAQWKATTGKHIHTVEHGNRIHSLAWSPDDKFLACTGQNLAAQLWELPLAPGKAARTLGEAGKTTWGVAWAPEGKTLAFGSSNGKTYFWDPATKRQTTIDVAPYYLAWSPDGSTLAMAADATPVHLVDAKTRQLIKKLEGSEGASRMMVPSGVLWSPDSKSVLFASKHEVALWNVAAAKRIRDFDAAYSLRIDWAPGKPVVTGVGDKTLSLWDPATLKRQALLEGHTRPVTAAAFAPKGTTVATSSQDKTVRLWNSTNGKPGQTLEGHTDMVNAVAWAADSATIASAGADKTVRLWKATGKPIRTLEGHANPIAALAWAPDGKTLASGDTQFVQLWKPESGDASHKLEIFAPIHSLAFSPGGKVLASGDGADSIRTWNPATGKAGATLTSAQEPRAVTALAWSPDGKTIAAGRDAFRLQLWQVASEKNFLNLPAWGPVHSVAWATSGKSVASCNGTGTALFWSPATGKRRMTLVAEKEWLVVIDLQGHFAATPEVDNDLVYVVQTDSAQVTLRPSDFAAKFRWKNTKPVLASVEK